MNKLKYFLLAVLILPYLNSYSQNFQNLRTNKTLSRQVYLDRLRGMWLAESIANWTGIVTEGQKPVPPFFTGADWGTNKGRAQWGGPKIDFVFQDPWGSDDDTDIEYTYLTIMNGKNSPHLTAEDIALGWKHHVNDWIWVSNRSARTLMDRGVLPPATSIGTLNRNHLQIDAQLTTEIFGALAPGMPAKALELANLPILTTASGYAGHAAQFYVVLYSLATNVDPKLSKREQMIWLAREAMKYIPETSKTYDIANFVLKDYLANPNSNDWEKTRDKVYDRYQLNAKKNGFIYSHWYESSVNFATGLIAMLYGEGDFKRTVQIGVLSGWDSDNGTATMGGLLGLMMGRDQIVAQFPGIKLSENYDIDRTRTRMPEYTPDVPGSKDNFELMAARMLPLIDQIVLEGKGEVSRYQNLYIIPKAPEGDYKRDNPLWKEYQASSNNNVKLKGGFVVAKSTGGNKDVSFIADGFEHDFSGKEVDTMRYKFYTSDKNINNIELSVEYSQDVKAKGVRFIEGDHTDDGGWFENIELAVLVHNDWRKIDASLYSLSTALDSKKPYQIIDFKFKEPMDLKGIRISGKAGGAKRYITACELDAFTELN
jgi:hypothetical protein